MARFAGSAVPNAPNFGRSAQVGGFEPMQMKSAGVKTNAGSAANAVSVGSIYGTLRDSAPKYGDIVTNAEKNRQETKIAGWKAEADMASAGIQAAASVAAAEEQAKAMEAQAAAASKGGAMSAIGGIASAAMGLFSDENTKHTIDEVEDALEALRSLRPVSFYYKEEYSARPERMHYGFIAQEYQKVMPDATYTDGATGLLCIDMQELIALLVRANQQLEQRVTRLEVENALVSV